MTNPRTTLDVAQSAYDSKEPPHDCKESGHKFYKHRVAFIAGDWVAEFKCKFCGKTVLE